MNINSKEVVFFDGRPHRKNVILADVNIPYKLSIDRKNNKLFFCINAEKFSNESFQSVIFDLESGSVNIIPGIRNGFASAVDQTNGEVYLGGSDGIFKYNYFTNDIEKPALVNSIDIFDMYFSKYLYFVDTSTQNLHIFKNNKNILIDEMKGNLTHHFIVDSKSNMYYVNPTGLFFLAKGTTIPMPLCTSDINIRGLATDIHDMPFFVAVDGIYCIDTTSKEFTKIFCVNDGNGLAFDKDNNIIYSEERSVIGLFPC